MMRFEITLDAEKLRKQAEAAAEKVLQDTGEEILRRSRAAAPHKSGALAASGTMRLTGNTVQIGYSVPYAPFVHEREGLHHANGRAHFLSEVVEGGEMAEWMKERFIESLKTERR